MISHFKVRLKAYFATGLLTTLPIALTLYVLNVGINLLDRFLGSPFATFIDGHKFPGIKFFIFGIEFILVLIIILLIGFFTANFIGRGLLRGAEGIIYRLPVINKIYSGIKQLIQTLFLKERGAFNQVVLVEYPRRGIYVIGFVTAKTNKEIQKEVANELINVFVPSTPNPTSGMFIFAQKDEVVPLNIGVEDGIKLIVSGGIISPGEN